MVIINSLSIYDFYDTAHSKSVVMIGEGWSFRDHIPNGQINAGVGDVRIIGWKSMGKPLFCGSKEIDLDGSEDLLAEVSLSGIVWDPISSIVSLQVYSSTIFHSHIT